MLHQLGKGVVGVECDALGPGRRAVGSALQRDDAFDVEAASPGLMTMVSKTPAIWERLPVPGARVVGGVEEEDHPLVVTAPESGPQSEAPLQGTVMSAPTMTPARHSWRVALPLNLKPRSISA